MLFYFILVGVGDRWGEWQGAEKETEKSLNLIFGTQILPMNFLGPILITTILDAKIAYNREVLDTDWSKSLNHHQSMNYHD